MLGYKSPTSHTNRELELMLAGRKPLAAFGKFSFERFDPTSGQDFESHVRSGRFLKRRWYRREIIDGKPANYVTIVYCLKEEEWRISLLRQVMRNLSNRWNDSLEAMEGLLLGYSPAEVARHIKEKSKYKPNEK